MVENRIAMNGCGLKGPTDGNSFKENVFESNVVESCQVVRLPTTWSRTMKPLLWMLSIALLGAGCDGNSQRPFRLSTPTAPTLASPRRRPRQGLTPIDVGQVVITRSVSRQPSVSDWPDGPVNTSASTAPSNGTLTIELRYIPETQPPAPREFQVVDVSIVGQNLETWSDYRDPATMALARSDYRRKRLLYTFLCSGD